MSSSTYAVGRGVVLFTCIIVLCSCGTGDGVSKEGDKSFGHLPDTLETLDYKLETEVVAQELVQPWAIEFIGPDTALVTEQPGQLRMIVDDTLTSEPVSDVPAVQYEGQGGLLDVAVDPNYSENGWVYLAYSHALDESTAEKEKAPSMTRVVRGRIQDRTWTNEQVVFEAPHDLYRQNDIQFGSRIVFGPEGHLYFSIGDRGDWPVDTTTVHAQQLNRPGGKIYRLNSDGTIPEDNPFVGRDTVLSGIYTYGHRNPQGLDVRPGTGTVWATEHGPRGGDELNRLEPGSNYGWPTITYGINYPGDIITPKRRQEGMEQPAFFWRPSIATSGLRFYEGDQFPYWQGQALVSTLKDQSIRLLTMAGNRVIHQEVILKGVGRVREAVPGPNGGIYVVMNAPSRIVRLSHAADYTARDVPQR